MSLTVPVIFEENRQDITAPRHFVVVLDDGSTKYAFSDFSGEFLIDSAHIWIQDLLISISSFRKEVDPLTKKWSICSPQVTLHNTPYSRDTSSPYRLTGRISDTLINKRYSDVTIYLLNNKRATDLETHCIKAFVGLLNTEPTFNSQTIQLDLVDISKTYDVLLPQNTMVDTYASTPLQYMANPIPLVYGQFTYDRDELSGLGMALGYPTTADQAPKFAFADHVLNAFTQLHVIDPQVTEPCVYASESLNVNDGGRGTGTGESEVIAVIYPVDDDDEGYTATESLTDATDAENAYDRTIASKAVILDNHTDDGSDTRGWNFWRIAEWVMATFTDVKVQCRGTALRPAPVSIVITLADLEGDTDADFAALTLLGSGSWASTANMSTNVNAATVVPNGIGISAVKTTDPSANGSTDDLNVCDVHELRVRLQYKLELHQIGYAECEGREYGAWITDRTSNYADGDMIEDPAGIIESLLRDELSMATADIDLVSFINAENTSVKARINLHDGTKATASKIFKQLAEQSTFVFLWTAAGKARAIDLSAAPGSVDRAIPYDRIVNGDIKITTSKFLVNKIKIQSRWHHEMGVFRDYDVVEDATSQTVNRGTWPYTAKWENIATTSADHVMAHLVNTTNGIWSKHHAVCNFSTDGWADADLEAGDWISFDSTSVDPHLLCRGVSFSGKKFLITKTEPKQDMINFEVMELF